MHHTDPLHRPAQRPHPDRPFLTDRPLMPPPDPTTAHWATADQAFKSPRNCTNDFLVLGTWPRPS